MSSETPTEGLMAQCVWLYQSGVCGAHPSDGTAAECGPFPLSCLPTVTASVSAAVLGTGTSNGQFVAITSHVLLKVCVVVGFANAQSTLHSDCLCALRQHQVCLHTHTHTHMMCGNNAPVR